MLKANTVCNQYGLDVDGAGGPIGWAMECYEKGIIDEKDTDGLKLEWGDAAVALELMRKISYREGFGNILAEGTRTMERRFDAPGLAVQVNGLDRGKRIGERRQVRAERLPDGLQQQQIARVL